MCSIRIVTTVYDISCVKVNWDPGIIPGRMKTAVSCRPAAQPRTNLQNLIRSPSTKRHAGCLHTGWWQYVYAYVYIYNYIYILIYRNIYIYIFISIYLAS